MSARWSKIGWLIEVLRDGAGLVPWQLKLRSLFRRASAILVPEEPRFRFIALTASLYPASVVRYSLRASHLPIESRRTHRLSGPTGAPDKDDDKIEMDDPDPCHDLAVTVVPLDELDLRRSDLD